MSPILLKCSGCGRLIERKPCPDCSRADNRRRHRKSVAHGLKSRGWELLRKQRLELDHYRCTLRLDGCTGRATTVHLDPDMKGNHWAAALDDLRSACAQCHGAIDAPRANDAKPDNSAVF